MPNIIIKLDEVKRKTTFSESTIYRLMSQGKFPKQVKLAERSCGWVESEVLEYLNKKISNRNA
ncbi:AlpA family transcriptional regulator [Candidatus Thioglobus sp.]|jgi:prophage regulatory protein|nr:AlpA family transcriptional regulator [Candidatus Thioglobus sp.]